MCLLAGYLCGCFLTAEAVARLRTGKSAGEMGSGNPGMANIAGALGPGWGALVLLGDIAKTALACLLCRFALVPGLGGLSLFYAGVGTVLGHNFPFYKGFRGGKGVAVTCAYQVFAAPVQGIASGLIGLAVVLITGYLPLGAVVIPAVFTPLAAWRYGAEAGVLCLLSTLLMLSRHIRGLGRIARGEEEKKLRRHGG